MGFFGDILSEVAKSAIAAAAEGAAAGVAEGLGEQRKSEPEPPPRQISPPNGVVALNNEPPGPSRIYAATERKLKPFLDQRFMQVEANGCWYLDFGEIKYWKLHLQCCLADGIDQLFETNFFAEREDPFIAALGKKLGFSIQKEDYPGLVQKHHLVPEIRALLDFTVMKCKERQHDLYPNIMKIETITCLCLVAGVNICVAISFKQFPDISIPIEILREMRLPTLDDL